MQKINHVILFTGQNGAVKENSKNGWNSNHMSHIEDGLVKNSTANFRGRQTEASAPDPSGVSFLHSRVNKNLIAFH